MDYQPILPQRTDKTSTMKSASFVLGILGIILSCFYLFGFPCSAMAIILGQLSKGDQPHSSGKGRIGKILGIIGLLLSILFAVFFIFIIIRAFQSSPDLLDDFMRQFDQLEQFQSIPGSL